MIEFFNLTVTILVVVICVFFFTGFDIIEWIFQKFPKLGAFLKVSLNVFLIIIAVILMLILGIYIWILGSGV